MACPASPRGVQRVAVQVCLRRLSEAVAPLAHCSGTFKNGTIKRDLLQNSHPTCTIHSTCTRVSMRVPLLGRAHPFAPAAAVARMRSTLHTCPALQQTRVLLNVSNTEYPGIMRNSTVFHSNPYRLIFYYSTTLSIPRYRHESAILSAYFIS